MKHPPQNILITGGSSGIGEALALHYASTGTHLCLTGRNADRLETVAETCRGQGAVVRVERLDVTDAQAMADLIQDLDSDESPLNLVIANAGISGGTAGGMETTTQAQKIFDVNVSGVLNTVHPAIEVMRPRKTGQIAIISSLAGFRGFPGAPAYSAGKAAVKAYDEALRGALRRDGIAVNVVCPGFVKSRITDANAFPMPFIMEGEKAARIIADGLQRNRTLIAFPWQMHLIMAFLAMLPAGLAGQVLGRLPEKG